MNGEAVDDGPREADADVGPAHARALCAVDYFRQPDSSHKTKAWLLLTFVVLPFLNILKIVDSRIVVILPREDDIVHIPGVGIGNGMAYFVSYTPMGQNRTSLTVRIPSPEA